MMDSIGVIRSQQSFTDNQRRDDRQVDGGEPAEQFCALFLRATGKRREKSVFDAALSGIDRLFR
jgi:hypothetical protein